MRLALAVLALAALACTKQPPKAADDGEYHGKGLGTLQRVEWNDVETDFSRAIQPNTLTFVELSGSHCAGCKKNLALAKKLMEARRDISFHFVPFPDELCPDHPDATQRAVCNQVLDETKHEGMCFTPTLWAFAPDGTLIARDDTCAGTRPASDLFHSLADKAAAKI
jgi:hypothetical protein